MRIVQLLFYVLMWCQATEALDQWTDLGQNVTINCDLDANEVYWILLKQSDSPTVILCSFSKSAHYFNKTLKNKYSVQSKHRLVIYNVTVDELGVYYCMNKDTPPKLSHSTRLNIIDPLREFTPRRNEYGSNIDCSSSKPTQLPEFTEWTNGHTDGIQNPNSVQNPFSLISGLLNAVLIITGLLSVCAFANWCRTRFGNGSEQMSKTDLTQFTEQSQDQSEFVTVVFKAV